MGLFVSFNNVRVHVNVRDHCILLHTKYLCSKPFGFREEDCFTLKLYGSVLISDPRGMASLGIVYAWL